MTFELMDRFLNTNISSVLSSETWSLQYFNHRIEVRTPAESERPLRDGSLGVAMSQALRARLRSHCPSGGLSDIGQKWAFFMFLDHQNSLPTL